MRDGWLSARGTRQAAMKETTQNGKIPSFLLNLGDGREKEIKLTNTRSTELRVLRRIRRTLVCKDHSHFLPDASLELAPV